MSLMKLKAYATSFLYIRRAKRTTRTALLLVKQGDHDTQQELGCIGNPLGSDKT